MKVVVEFCMRIKIMSCFIIKNCGISKLLHFVYVNTFIHSSKRFHFFTSKTICSRDIWPKCFWPKEYLESRHMWKDIWPTVIWPICILRHVFDLPAFGKQAFGLQAFGQQATGQVNIIVKPLITETKTRNTKRTGRLSTVDLLIKVACFVIRIINVFNKKTWWS